MKTLEATIAIATILLAGVGSAMAQLSDVILLDEKNERTCGVMITTNGSILSLGQSAIGPSLSSRDDLKLHAGFLPVLSAKLPTQAPAALLAEPGGIQKVRYLSMIVPTSGAGSETALRIELKSLSLFGADLGFEYVTALRDATGQPVFDCPDSPVLGASFKCAVLSCTPEYRDWAGELGGQVLHVTGPAVVPRSFYHAAQLASGCAGQETTCALASADLVIATTLWADVNGDLSLNVIDVSNEVDVIKGVAGHLPKYHAQVQPNTTDPLANLTVLEVANVVDSVKGFLYPFSGPNPCPSSALSRPTPKAGS